MALRKVLEQREMRTDYEVQSSEIQVLPHMSSVTFNKSLEPLEPPLLIFLVERITSVPEAHRDEEMRLCRAGAANYSYGWGPHSIHSLFLYDF